MPTPFRNNSAAFSVDGFVFARSVLDQKGDDAVQILLEAAGGNETDWLEKKAAVYRSEKADKKYREKMEKLRASKGITPERIAEEEKILQDELLAEIAWAIVALHNSRGGVVLVGVDDRNGAVPFAENDPSGILTKEGVESYVRKAVMGRLCPEKKEGDPLDTLFQIKNGTVSLPVKQTGVFPCRRWYGDVEVVALLVPSLERDKEPLLATITTCNSPWRTAPQRGAGDWGRVEKGRHDDPWIGTAGHLSDFHQKRKQRFLDGMDLTTRFRELGLSLPVSVVAEESATPAKEPFSSVRPPRAKNFVGRDKELEELHGLLSKGTVTVVTGPGGTGKTELVRHYVARNKADYPGGLFQIDMEGLTDWEQAFRLMLEKPGVRDALGLPENEEDEIGGEAEKELLDIRMAEKGDATGMPFAKRMKDGIARKPKTKSVPEILSARAGREGPILLVLDNVDPPACKTLFNEAVLSKLNLPSELRIVATARASDLTFPVNGACKEYKLRDFSKDVAVDFLTAAHPPTSEAERKAVERVAWMLDCRILYLETIPALIGDDDSPFAGSWQALERGLRDDLESVVNAGMEGDEARTPAALWRQTERLFSSNRSNGARWILLARIASFFSPDHGVRKTVLSALWKGLAKPDGDPDIAFSQATNKLRKHGVLEARGDEFGMHRLTCAAIRGSARNEEPDLEESIGLALSETSCSEGRDWVSLAGSLPALRHIPEDLLDGPTSVDILRDNLQFAALCPWTKLDYRDWRKLLGIHPHLIGRLKHSAEEGSANAQHILGCCYGNGCGVERNSEEAVKWFREAADQGYALAQLTLGAWYQDGRFVERNYGEAVKWFGKAAEQENAGAQYELGWCHDNGRGVKKNYEEAVRWYRKAAMNGNEIARLWLGKSFLKGSGGKRNAEEALLWFLNAANEGDVFAQRCLGISFLEGRVVERNPEKALKWFRKAAEQEDRFATMWINATERGCAGAQTVIGDYYKDGVGVSVERNSEEAVKWFRKAAEQGNARAQYNLGVCYANGEGVEQNDEESVEWYRKAAEQGFADAQFKLGWAYNSGKGVKQSNAEAVKWYRKAADQGDAVAQFNLGVCYANGKGVEQSYEEAVKWFGKAAEQEDVDAQCRLGWCYDNGRGVKKNYEEAVRWYRRAAMHGHDPARRWLVASFLKGSGGKRNAEEALQWFLNAANKGDIFAQRCLGISFLTGRGVERNPEKAMKWFREAAALGDTHAQVNLGVCYATGDGVEQNYEEAVKWYREAAEQGDTYAQMNLGICYKTGRGVEQNYGEAVKWFGKAAERGEAKAQVFMGEAFLFGKGIAKNEDESFRWFQRAENNDPAIAWLGYCFASGTGTPKDEKEAEACFAKIKDVPGGFNEVAWRLFENGKAPEALPFAERAVAAFRGNGTFPVNGQIKILDTLAAVLDALERSEETKKVCSEILSRMQDSDDSKNREVAFVRLGRACQRLGDQSGAVDAWSKALVLVKKHGGKHAEYGESADELRRLIRESGGAEQ